MKVSVVVPVYNSEPWLARCVDSLLGQTLADIEVVLVDDGSTDASGAMIDAYAARDPRVKAVLHPQNQGLPNTRHTGMHAASGEYVIFNDSDDYRPLDALELLYAKAKESGADLVAGDYWESREAGSPDFVRRSVPVLNADDRAHAIRSFLNGELRGSVWTLLVRRELYLASVHQPVRMSPGDDTVLSAQLLKHVTKVAQVHAPVYYYVLRKGSLASYGQQRSMGQLADQALMIRKVLDVFEDDPDRVFFNDALAVFALLNLGSFHVYRAGRDFDVGDLETRIFRDHFPNRAARRVVRKQWPKEYIFLMSGRHIGWRIVQKALWGTPAMRHLARTFRKILHR